MIGKIWIYFEYHKIIELDRRRQEKEYLIKYHKHKHIYKWATPQELYQ